MVDHHFMVVIYNNCTWSKASFLTYYISYVNLFVISLGIIIYLDSQIPIVDDEMKKAAGETTDEDTAITQGSVQKLVTADGTYATQSAFSTTATIKKDIVRYILNRALYFYYLKVVTNIMEPLLHYSNLVGRKYSFSAMWGILL